MSGAVDGNDVRPTVPVEVRDRKGPHTLAVRDLVRHSSAISPISGRVMHLKVVAAAVDGKHVFTAIVIQVSMYSCGSIGIVPWLEGRIGLLLRVKRQRQQEEHTNKQRIQDCSTPGHE